jgi:hypothetical protein
VAPWTPLVVQSSALYGTTMNGGTHSNGTLFALQR